MALDARIRGYKEALEASLKRSDPEDSNFLKGFDNAISNVVFALDRFLLEDVNE